MASMALDARFYPYPASRNVLSIGCSILALALHFAIRKHEH